MRAIPLLVLASLLAPTLAAQSFVVPPSAANTLGGSPVGFPFSYTDYVLYQQAIGTSNFAGPGVILGMALRSQTPGTIQSVPDPATQGLRVTLADSNNAPASLSATYANNLGANAVVVFDGVVNVQKVNQFDPLEWNVAIPFAAPYLHINTAPLLVQMFPTSYQGQTCNGGGNGTSFDGASDPTFGTVIGKGPCGTGPAVGQVSSGSGFVFKFFTDSNLLPYGKACQGTNGQTPQISSSGGATVGNASFLVQLSGGAAQVNLSAFMLGGSNMVFGGGPLPLELGGFAMPNCYLHQDIAFNVGFPVAGGVTVFPLPIPNNPSLSGNSVFSQWALVDPGANAAGVITGQGGWIFIR